SMPATATKTKQKAKPKAAKAANGRAAAKASDGRAPAKGAARAGAQGASARSAGRQVSRERQGSGERHQNEGHGRRLTMAFEALEAFPALAESRNRLLTVISKDHVATADIVSAVESDVALIVAVLRMANRGLDGRARVETAVAAVEALQPPT